MNNKCKYTLGKKLPEYPAQEEEVLLLEERVSEAKRLAVMVKFRIEPSYNLHYFFTISFLKNKVRDFVGTWKLL